MPYDAKKVHKEMLNISKSVTVLQVKFFYLKLNKKVSVAAVVTAAAAVISLLLLLHVVLYDQLLLLTLKQYFCM